MYSNNLEQLINFIYFIITGIFLSIIFDVFRILRRTFKTSDIITNIEDIVYGIITGLIILMAIFLFNNGELRLYIFLGMIIGIILYMLFISTYFIKINLFIIKIIKNAIKFITKPFIIILKFIKRNFFRPISFTFINIKLFIKKIFINVKENIKISKKENKMGGF